MTPKTEELCPRCHQPWSKHRVKSFEFMITKVECPSG